MVKLEEESIYNLVPMEKPEKSPFVYKSKYSPHIFPTGSTLGLHGSTTIVKHNNLFFAILIFSSNRSRTPMGIMRSQPNVSKISV
jgi:hypothetical protein